MPRQFETENNIRQQDLEELVNNSVFDKFRDKTVLITGATGFIGSETVLAFLCANRIKNLNTKIVALVRNLEKAHKIFEHIIDDCNLEIIVQDIIEPIEYTGNVDYIIHCASNTQSKYMLEKPATTASIILDGTKRVLDFAKEKKVISTVFLSSIEVYGSIDSDLEIKENDNVGQIDITSPRSSYPLAKRMAENLCVDYSTEYGIDTKIARLTQIIGAGIKYNDTRVFAQFARSVIEQQDIVLHTKGETTRNYCYITDCVSGILSILIDGKNKEIYNVANSDTKCSIREIAEKFAKMGNLDIKYETKEHKEYPPEIKCCLNSDKLLSLGWEPQIMLQEMLDRLTKSMNRDRKNEV